MISIKLTIEHRKFLSDKFMSPLIEDIKKSIKDLQCIGKDLVLEFFEREIYPEDLVYMTKTFPNLLTTETINPADWLSIKLPGGRQSIRIEIPMPINREESFKVLASNKSSLPLFREIQNIFKRLNKLETEEANIEQEYFESHWYSYSFYSETFLKPKGIYTTNQLKSYSKEYYYALLEKFPDLREYKRREDDLNDLYSEFLDLIQI